MSAVLSIREVEWEKTPLVEPKPDAELERWARAEGAPRVYPVRFFTRCPWLMRAMVHLSTLPLAHLDYDLSDVIALVVSRDNSCRYCYVRARFLLRAIGMSEERIESLEGDLFAAEIEPRTRLGLEFARRVSRSNPPPSAADVKALREAGFSREELLELAFVAAQYVVINRVITFIAIPLGGIERINQGWVLRLMRPLVQRLRRKRRLRPPPESPSGQERSGPFVSEVAGFAGLPAGPKLRLILDDAWASPILTKRAKALAFAVAARGLGVEQVEREAVHLLAQEGFDRTAAEQALAHLASPALSPVESALLPFVRETLWYEAAPLQRQARKLRERLTDEEILETIGIAALANAVCRISRALEAIG